MFDQAAIPMSHEFLWLYWTCTWAAFLPGLLKWLHLHEPPLNPPMPYRPASFALIGVCTTSGPAPVPLECHRSSLGWPPHNQLWTAWPWIHFSQDSLPLVCWAGHCRAEGPQLAESSLNADTSIPSAGLCSSGVTELVPKPVMSILPVSALTQFH